MPLDQETDPSMRSQPPGGSSNLVPTPVTDALRRGLVPLAIRLAVRWGLHDENKLTNLIFLARHPERQGRALRRDEPRFAQLSREWLDIRAQMVRPALNSGAASVATPTVPAPSRGVSDRPREPFGVLTATIAGRTLRYQFTQEDVEWTARFIVGEAGGRDDRENRAIIWAMFNRYALFTQRVFPSFQAFLRAYSTTLQPVLNSKGAAKRHMDRPNFVRTGGYYPDEQRPRGRVPKGQLRQHLDLQAARWSTLPAPARQLAEQALKGQIPNPGIGNASEFADTAVYFKDQNGRLPNYEEWLRFSQGFPRNAGKNWTWVGAIEGLTQYRINTFYVDNRALRLPPGTIQVLAGRTL